MRPHHRLGVDVLERKKAAHFFRSHRDRLKDIFSPAEIAYLGRSTDKARAFARLWAAKESALKALGRPLFGADSLRGVRLSPARGFTVRGSGLRVSFREDDHHVVAVCHPGSLTCAGN